MATDIARTRLKAANVGLESVTTCCFIERRRRESGGLKAGRRRKRTSWPEAGTSETASTSGRHLKR